MCKAHSLFFSDPEAYAQLILCISDKHEDTPSINAAILVQQKDTENTGSFDVLQPRYDKQIAIWTQHRYIHTNTQH